MGKSNLMKNHVSALCVARTLLLTTLVFGQMARAQNITGSITGRVIDGTGSAVVNAAVTIADSAAGVRSAQKTSSSGDFTVSSLLPGVYTVTVEAAGFKKLIRNNINLDANDKLALGDLSLEVGSVTESIEISAQTVLLQAESVERSATISGKQLENIEVNGRNALDLAKLVPGVARLPQAQSYAVGNSGTGANTFKWQMVSGRLRTSCRSTASATSTQATMAA